jgi:hypothetical protein
MTIKPRAVFVSGPAKALILLFALVALLKVFRPSNQGLPVRIDPVSGEWPAYITLIYSIEKALGIPHEACYVVPASEIKKTDYRRSYEARGSKGLSEGGAR